MEIVFSIISILSFLFCSVVIIDKTIFDKKIKEVEHGMTGKEVQEVTNTKIEILLIDNDRYYARISSKLTLFRYRLVFFKGKLVSKQRE